MTNILGARIQAARLAANYSQTAAAQELGWSTQSLTAYEQGRRGPSDAALEAMATLYGVPVPVLRYGEEVLRLAASQSVADELRRAAVALLETASVIDPPANQTTGDPVTDALTRSLADDVKAKSDPVAKTPKRQRKSGR